MQSTTPTMIDRACAQMALAFVIVASAHLTDVDAIDRIWRCKP